MRLHVAFLPSLVLPGGPLDQARDRPFDRAPFDEAPFDAAQGRQGRQGRQVCVVVDVIRASTTLVTLVERGAGPVFIASDILTARESARTRDGVLLTGEEEGLAPSGFDYGNSPVELSRADLTGKSVIFVTTNGTAAIRAVQHAGPVLVGALRNGTAVCREAWETAGQLGADLTIVCAGRESAFAVDDAFCAGYLVDRLLQLGAPDLTDAALAALRLYRSEPDSLALLRQSSAGKNVIRLGLAADVAYCAERDASSVVPRLGRELHLLETREDQRAVGSM